MAAAVLAEIIQPLKVVALKNDLQENIKVVQFKSCVNLHNGVDG